MDKELSEKILGGHIVVPRKRAKARGTLSKVSVVEATFVLALSWGIDMMELTTSFVGVGLLLWFIDILFLILVVVLFAFKGGVFHGRIFRRQLYKLSATLLELIPIVEMLPIRTGVMIWTIWDWNRQVDLQEAEDKAEDDYLAKLAEKYTSKFLDRFGEPPPTEQD